MEGLGADGLRSPRSKSLSVPLEDLDGTPKSRVEAAEDELAFLVRELSTKDSTTESPSGWSYSRARASSTPRVSRGASDPTDFRQVAQWRRNRPPARSGTTPSFLEGRESRGGLLWPLLRTVVTPPDTGIMEERRAKEKEALDLYIAHQEKKKRSAQSDCSNSAYASITPKGALQLLKLRDFSTWRKRWSAL